MGNRDGTHRHLETMAHLISVHREVLHLPDMADQMLRAAGRSAILHHLHRIATGSQALKECGDGPLGARRHPLSLAIDSTQRDLHHIPHVTTDGMHAQQVGQNPIHPRRELGHAVGKTGGNHLFRRFFEHIGIAHDHYRGSAGHRLFESFKVDGGAVGGVSVHRRGGAHHHIRAVKLSACPLGHVIEGPRGEDHGDRIIQGKRHAHPGDG